ncbi:ATP-binding protein [Lentzea sp. HUAS12]|uniref:sensor histidine kinase n=1 Tax=Lentzea sp. HUAS12 TaxID=2951806 RepID=UPI00209FE660|nr:ATP-binding protein [Lentzea sp. HUAS12]USX54723.1 ATP-binding protein [Lentzea sp. HUAS12]
MHADSGGPSLRRWSVWISVALVAVLLAATTAVLLAISDLSQARSRLLDVVGPAVVSAQQLGADLVDQENGVRGYVLSGSADFLEPYENGLDRQSAARATVVALNTPKVAEGVNAVDAALAAWRSEYADPAIAAVRAGTPVPDDAVGKQRFDAVRAALSTLQAELAVQRTEGRAALNDSATGMAVTCIVALAVLLIAVLGCVAAMLVYVVRPLSRLREHVGQVAGGDFAHVVTASGPQELQVLGHDVDKMRVRIVDELDQAQERNAALDAATEDLRRSNTELEQFAYVASHDLQEPLRKVASFCQLLERRYRDKLDERGIQYVDFAVDGAKRMQRLINDLLAFSRVGRHRDEQVVVAAADLVEEARGNLSHVLEESGAVVEVGTLPEVQGEARLLTAVFQNLIGNAVKFHGDQPPHVWVDAEPGEDGMWEFSVRDNGIGIEEQYAERVFVIFQRLHAKETYPGTGIGLSMCRKIVEHHGGRIWLDTTATGGTTFRFTLPGADADVTVPVG